MKRAISFSRSLILLSFHLIIFLMLLSSCINQKKETQAPVQVEQAIDEVRSLPSYTYTDSLMQGSHMVVYTITSGADEELPFVVDEDGVKYKDNRYKLFIILCFTHYFKQIFEAVFLFSFKFYHVHTSLLLSLSVRDGKNPFLKKPQRYNVIK